MHRPPRDGRLGRPGQETQTKNLGKLSKDEPENLGQNVP